MLGLARKLLPELRVLGGDPDGAGVQVALAHHDAPQRDQGRRGEAELFGAQEGRRDHVFAVLELPVGLEPDAGPEVVEDLKNEKEDREEKKE